MKKNLIWVLAALMALVLCVGVATAEDAAVMSYEEYMAAEIDSEVTIESYVQAHESWWDNKISVHLQDEVGAYYAYKMVCSEEDAAKLVPGTKIRVTGYKAQWPEGNGLIELADGCTFEFVEADPYIAEAKDITDQLGTENLVDYMNQYVSFSGLTIVASKKADDETEYAFLYDYDGSGNRDSSDIYFTASLNDQDYSFVVRRYLTDKNSETFQAVEALNVGDVVDIEGFLYWYTDAQPHITKITVK